MPSQRHNPRMEAALEYLPSSQPLPSKHEIETCYETLTSLDQASDVWPSHVPMKGERHDSTHDPGPGDTVPILTRNQFASLLNLIRFNQLFATTNEGEASISDQLRVALFQLGTKDVPIEHVARVFGFSPEMVHTYTWRCIQAIRDLQSEFVVWPDQLRKKEIGQWFEENKRFPECIGAVDSMQFRLGNPPTYDSTSWINDEGFYTVGSVFVCDHQGQFTFVSTGYGGSIADSRAYKSTQLYTLTKHFFQDKEYLLADSDYDITPTIMTPYEDATGEQLRFNLFHSSARAVVERALYRLKLKFQSLQSLPVMIQEGKDVDLASSWILACSVLHNFILREKEADMSCLNDDDDNETSILRSLYGSNEV